VHEAPSSGSSWLRCDHAARFRLARPGQATAMKTTIVTVGAVAVTAAVGGCRGRPPLCASPRWQPPPPACALAWTPLYVTIACAGARALTRAQSRHRSQLAGGLILDLALNAAWTPICSSAPGREGGADRGTGPRRLCARNRAWQRARRRHRGPDQVGRPAVDSDPARPPLRAVVWAHVPHRSPGFLPG